MEMALPSSQIVPLQLKLEKQSSGKYMIIDPKYSYILKGLKIIKKVGKTVGYHHFNFPQNPFNAWNEIRKVCFIPILCWAHAFIKFPRKTVIALKKIQKKTVKF